MSTSVSSGSAEKKISSWVRPGCARFGPGVAPGQRVDQARLADIERPANDPMPRILGSDSSELAAVAKSHGLADKGARLPLGGRNSDAVLTPVRLAQRFLSR
jgi:hypothetical protein